MHQLMPKICFVWMSDALGGRRLRGVVSSLTKHVFYSSHFFGAISERIQLTFSTHYLIILLKKPFQGILEKRSRDLEKRSKALSRALASEVPRNVSDYPNFLGTYRLA